MNGRNGLGAHGFGGRDVTNLGRAAHAECVRMNSRILNDAQACERLVEPFGPCLLQLG